jgi:hypothetical protein
MAKRFKRDGSFAQRVKRRAAGLLKLGGRFIKRRPVLVAAALSLIYLLLLQRKFLFAGDVWAETHMEFLDRAVNAGNGAVYAPGWAGYMTLLPNLLSKAYIYLGFPMGYIDYFYKGLIVFFAVGCAAFCAGRLHRPLIKNDALRIWLGLALLVLLNDIGIFSYINIWYLGFIPIILVCLNDTPMSRMGQLVYAVFGVLLSLTKPTFLLLPFIVYRAYKTKEYLSNALIGLAIAYQTYVMMVLDPRESGANATRDIPYIIRAVFVGGSTELLKILHIPPSPAAIILTNVLLAGLAVLLVRGYGLLKTGLLFAGYALSVYLYVLAPDAPLFGTFDSYTDIYNDHLKTQREYLIYFFLLLLFILSLQAVYRLYLKKRLSGRYITAAFACLSLLLLIHIYKPIDVESAGVAANINQFRYQLNTRQSTCMPIPPTPAFLPNANWVFQFNTACHARNFDLNPDFENMDMPLKTPWIFNIPNDMPDPFGLKTVYLVIKNEDPGAPASFTLTDKDTRVTYTGYIPAREHEKINYIPLNVTGMPYRKNYDFIIAAGTDKLYWGMFKDSQKPLYYPYFGETRRPDIR